MCKLIEIVNQLNQIKIDFFENEIMKKKFKTTTSKNHSQCPIYTAHTAHTISNRNKIHTIESEMETDRE